MAKVVIRYYCYNNGRDTHYCGTHVDNYTILKTSKELSGDQEVFPGIVSAEPEPIVKSDADRIPGTAVCSGSHHIRQRRSQAAGPGPAPHHL